MRDNQKHILDVHKTLKRPAASNTVSTIRIGLNSAKPPGRSARVAVGFTSCRLMPRSAAVTALRPFGVISSTSAFSVWVAHGPLARLKPTGDAGKAQVLCWNGQRWAAPGPFGIATMPLDAALDTIASEPHFWINA